MIFLFMKKLKSPHRRFVRFVVHKEDLLTEMNEFYIKEKVNSLVKKFSQCFHPILE